MNASKERPIYLYENRKKCLTFLAKIHILCGEKTKELMAISLIKYGEGTDFLTLRQLSQDLANGERVAEVSSWVRQFR